MSHLTECVVPALVEGAQVPSASELPEDLRPLTRRHAVELSEGAWGSQVGQLMDSLERARVPSPVGERAAWSVHVRNISRRERVLAMVATVKAEDAADLALPVILTTPSGDAQGLLRFGVKGLVGPLKWLTLDVDDQRVYTEGDPDS